MAAKPKEKFDAAVKVIQSLPKNGSFQPSNELLLRFYGFYKQATLGQCRTPKPAFYDIIGKAKWDAWNKLGTMPAEDAMLCYVDELKKSGVIEAKEQIVEAMPHTTMVAEFVEKLGTFYELVDEAGNAKKPAKGGVAKGGVPNGTAGGAALGNGAGVDINGHGESTPPHSVSDDSSESREISQGSSPVHGEASPVVPASSTNEVTVAHIQNKGAPPPGSPAHSDHTLPPPIVSPGQNGVLGNGPEQFADSDALTDSDGDEFCDTSDLPDEQLRSVSRSSSPEAASHSQIITTATVHADHAGLPLTPDHPAHNLHQQPINDLVTCRGGGDSVDRQVPGVSRADGVNSPSNMSRGAASWDSYPPQRSTLLATGGGAGGDRDPGPALQRSDVTEQIAIALVRLQQDMTSVLARLNTLEALSVAQHQMHRSRHSSESDRSNRTASRWWWPFPSLDTRSVFFIMAWPLIVHWVLTVLARRRHSRRR